MKKTTPKTKKITLKELEKIKDKPKYKLEYTSIHNQLYKKTKYFYEKQRLINYINQINKHYYWTIYQLY